MSDVTSTAQVDDAVGVWYQPTLLDVALPLLLADQFGTMTSIPEGSSKSVKWSRYEALTEATVPLTEGVEPDGQQLTVTRMEATCSQYGDVVILTDVVELTVSDPVANQATKRLGEQMGRTLDTLTYDVLVSTGTVYDCQYGSNLGSPTDISDSDCDEIVESLMSDDAPMFTEVARASTGVGTGPLDESYYAMTNTALLKDLKELDSWDPLKTYPNPAERKKGERGYTDYIRWCLSSKAPVSSGVYDFFVVAQDAYIVVDIMNGNAEMIYTAPGGAGDRLKQRSSFGWKAWHTAKIQNDNNLVRGRCTLA